MARADIAGRLAIGPDSGDAELVAAVDEWVETAVPEGWRRVAADGRQAIRAVRSRDEYAGWYPVFAASGPVVATWPVAYKVPVRFEFLDRLPRSETGKVLRRELAAQP